MASIGSYNRVKFKAKPDPRMLRCPECNQELPNYTSGNEQTSEKEYKPLNSCKNGKKEKSNK